MDASIRQATARDATAIAAIYNDYICSTCITFETDPVEASEMAARIAEVHDAKLPWLVAEHGGELLGYAYASKWKGRCAYRYSAESTVYLARLQQRRGLGRQLYAALLDTLKRSGYHAVIGGIALPNDASVALHERLGFRKVAHFEQVGYKLERWVDVGYWQLLLDRDAAPRP